MTVFFGRRVRRVNKIGIPGYVGVRKYGQILCNVSAICATHLHLLSQGFIYTDDAEKLKEMVKDEFFSKI